MREVVGKLDGVHIVYTGIRNNVCNSLIAACMKTGVFTTALSVPFRRSCLSLQVRPWLDWLDQRPSRPRRWARPSRSSSGSREATIPSRSGEPSCGAPTANPRPRAGWASSSTTSATRCVNASTRSSGACAPRSDARQRLCSAPCWNRSHKPLPSPGACLRPDLCVAKRRRSSGYGCGFAP